MILIINFTFLIFKIILTVLTIKISTANHLKQQFKAKIRTNQTLTQSAEIIMVDEYPDF